MIRISWLVAVFITWLVVGLTGCSSPTKITSKIDETNSTGASTPSLTVTVGYFPNVTHAPAVLGFTTERQTYAKTLAGQATVQTKVFNAGPAAMEALHAKAIDLCFVGPTPAINAHARGGDVVLVANVANGGSALVARKGSGIVSIKDLEGNKLAVPQLGNTQDALLRHLLLQSNIKLKDHGGTTTVLPVENPDILGLFTRGELDAACVPEPWASRLVLETGATVILDSKTLWRDGNYPVTILVVRRKFLEQHEDVVQAFVTALQSIIDQIASNPESEVTALNDELGKLTGKPLKPEVITRALKQIVFTSTIDQAAIQAMAEVTKEIGYSKIIPDINGFIVDRFIQTSESKQPVYKH